MPVYKITMKEDNSVRFIQGRTKPVVNPLIVKSVRRDRFKPSLMTSNQRKQLERKATVVK